MGLFDIFKKEKKKDEKVPGPRFLYSDAELDELDAFICDMFGTYENVFHEIVSPDIHLDVCIVDPTEEDPYYKMVTMGAGAYKMAIPDQWKEYNLDYAEYVIYLPKDWNINSGADEDYWPIRTLKTTARLPIDCDTWLCYGHTLQSDEEGSPYASNTGFNSVVLDFAENKKGDIRMIMPSGKVINFYEVIPLYPEELKFKIENGADALFEKFKEKGIQYKILDINRKNAML
ncbi:MAG: suppressor of fused domain protein [Firmicutes bacterium]|nr:suppressor of fused domain protein [Bacillota bacterium]MBR0482433.1 suppressor of fused domain protein [Bacillota bacterium]